MHNFVSYLSRHALGIPVFQRFKLGTSLVQQHKQSIGGPVKPKEIVSPRTMNSFPTKRSKTPIPPLLTHYSFIHTQDYLQHIQKNNNSNEKRKKKTQKNTREYDENLRGRFPSLSGVVCFSMWFLC